MNNVNNAFCPDAYLFKANLEGQTNRFGKREINWHIAACARKKDIYVLNTYLHILYSTLSMSPGSRLTATPLIDVVKDVASRK